MDIESFNTLFETEIATPLAAIGAVRDEHSLFWESDSLTVGLLRTGNRATPPPQLTLFVRHKVMRDLDEKLPSRLTRRPNDYPFKLAPSSAASLLDPNFVYTPLNLGDYPAEVYSCPPESPEEIQARLAELATLLNATLPQLESHLTAAKMLAHLTDEGDNAWCEQLWIQDLKAVV